MLYSGTDQCALMHDARSLAVPLRAHCDWRQQREQIPLLLNVVSLDRAASAFNITLQDPEFQPK